MSKNEISSTVAFSVIAKLINESIPTFLSLAYGDRIVVHLKGFVHDMDERGLTFSVDLGKPPGSSFLFVRLDSEDREFFFEDAREWSSDIREDAATKYGDTLLSVDVESGFRLNLYFSSLDSLPRSN